MLNTAHFLGFDHLDAVALLVDEKAVLFAFDGLSVLVVDADLVVLRHLPVELALVAEELVAALGHLSPLSLFGLLLCPD